MRTAIGIAVVGQYTGAGDAQSTVLADNVAGVIGSAVAAGVLLALVG